jgi:hypothetical protein
MSDPTIHSVEEIYAQLTLRDEVALISLPYRIGLYLSYSDTTGGWDAQEAELVTLAGILREFSEDFCKTEFTQITLMNCLKNRSDWPAWSQNIGTVPEDISRVIGVLTAMFMPKELDSFKEAMVEIAVAVAMAFREHSEHIEPSEEKFSLKDIVSKLSGGRKADPLEHINISPHERDALRRVCSAMNYNFAG